MVNIIPGTSPTNTKISSGYTKYQKSRMLPAQLYCSSSVRSLELGGVEPVLVVKSDGHRPMLYKLKKVLFSVPQWCNGTVSSCESVELACLLREVLSPPGSFHCVSRPLLFVFGGFPCHSLLLFYFLLHYLILTFVLYCILSFQFKFSKVWGSYLAQNWI